MLGAMRYILVLNILSALPFIQAEKQTLSQALAHRLLLEERQVSATIADAAVMSCDSAFVSCVPNVNCLQCYMDLKMHDVDWATVIQNTACNTSLDLLMQKGHCNLLNDDKEGTSLFCNTYQACINQQQQSADKKSNNTDVLDCNKLEECQWDGIHTSWLGDGVCHDAMPGCYNSAACGYDGGDCCSDTCKKAKGNFLNCGDNGFACRDPKSSDCDRSLANCPNIEDDSMPYADDDDDVIGCTDDDIPYRIVMYDSFGDGWDNTTLEIYPFEDSSPLFKGGLEKGSQGTRWVCLKQAPTCYKVKFSGGMWGKECSYEVKGATEGSPRIASGVAPQTCLFSTGGADCGANKCLGEPNQNRTVDPDYKKFKDLSKCIEDKCLIQVGACRKDPVCVTCFKAQIGDYCYAVPAFKAVVDCSMCQCTDKKNSEFCADKARPDMIIPTNKDKPTDTGMSIGCTPAETLKGSAAVMGFANCTDVSELSMMVTDFKQNNFGDLDVFETCAHEYASRDSRGGHTALGCLQILVKAMNGKMDDEALPNSTAPTKAIAALAANLYHDGGGFCDCAKVSSDACPLCPSFIRFKTLLYEALDACQALDEIDCGAWDEFSGSCLTNLQQKFSTTILSNESCTYVKNDCGGAGPFPSFRRLDCENEISSTSWNFYKTFSESCLKQPVPSPAENNTAPVTPPVPAPVPPPVPAPVNPPTSPVPAPVPKPEPNPFPTPVKPPYTPYVPTEELNKKDKKSHWFRNLVLLSLIGGAGYFFYKRRADGFSFIRYRRMMRSSFGDGDMYSGLALESSTHFEPPSLPPTPAALGGDQYYYQ